MPTAKKKLNGISRCVIDFMRRECYGKDNAKLSSEISHRCFIKGRELRFAVNDLRQKGWPICSDNHIGYWYAAAESDLDATIKHMVGRRNGINDALRGLRAARKGMASSSP